MNTTSAEAQEQGSSFAYINIDGIDIRYKTGGVGDQVLLLHGWGGSIESMTAVFEELARSHTVFALDFPGHGKSGLPPRPWGVADFAACLLRFMDAIQLRRPHIISHSFGGRVTIKLAASHPERVGKIILVDSAGIIPPRPLKYHLRVSIAKVGKFFARYGGRFGERMRGWLYSIIGSKDYMNAGPIRGTFVKIVNEDLSALMPQIKSPTLLIWGADDLDTPVSSARTMNRLIQNSELVILESAGHYSYIDQPNQFNLFVRRFLRS